MKKSQLRNIIKESIKQLMTEQGTVPSDIFTANIQIYQGCHLAPGTSTSTGVGNNYGIGNYNGFAVNQGAPGGSYIPAGMLPTMQAPPQSTVAAYEPYITNNSNILHNLWNTPSVGQVIRFCTCDDWELNPQCECTCLKYLGSTDAWNGGTWSGGTLQNVGFQSWVNLNPQPNYVFNSCEDCSNTVSNGQGCLDPNALNPNQCCPDPVTGVVDPNCIPTGPENHCCDYGPSEYGCLHWSLNSGASNYGQCCSGVPGCVPNAHDQSCCVWEDKGCLDKAALNYGECCWNPSPNCIPQYPSNEECCRYSHEPCEICCCEKKQIIHPVAGDDMLKEQAPTNECVPNSGISLSSTTNPCVCPPGMMQTPCDGDDDDVDFPLQERFQKLANISKK